MTSTTLAEETRSGPTLSCHTHAIVLREGAGAVGSTFARKGASAPGFPVPPSSREVLEVLEALEARGARGPREASCPREPRDRERDRDRDRPRPPLPSAHVVLPGPSFRRSVVPARPGRLRTGSPPNPVLALTWLLPVAFASGATLAALIGLLVDRGLELAALASAIAGGATLAVGMTARAPRRDPPGKPCARRPQKPT